MLTSGNLDFILQVGGIRGLEWFIILIAILFLLFGTNKLPELARALGRATGEFEKARMEMERELQKAVYPEAPTPNPPVATAKKPETVRKTPPLSRPKERIVYGKNLKVEKREQAPSTPLPVTPPSLKVGRDKLVKIAEELGISTEGKTAEELRREITRALT
ncbi:twin-arginine translocase TatA/TatE family subunit [Candidatus Hecatella orcuttiae]|jgi:TatA/E family protein of Tat protein translocase|uniref:twin-arginine translocase TatA/TatE family subunit n=1 Tax=Candidatus Hecatella orcuttiae TaxID=1935119 RepID=UPI0028680932|nr:twin-arginine translocase TatA/TatE family subunit [Candidatus Hecatella orcuttiae]